MVLVCRMFYFFFESRNSKKDPVVIWLTGGPGCSSELAVFYENGPFSIADNMSLVWNEHGWDKVSLFLFNHLFIYYHGDRLVWNIILWTLGCFCS